MKQQKYFLYNRDILSEVIFDNYIVFLIFGKHINHVFKWILIQKCLCLSFCLSIENYTVVQFLLLSLYHVVAVSRLASTGTRRRSGKKPYLFSEIFSLRQIKTFTHTTFFICYLYTCIVTSEVRLLYHLLFSISFFT